MISETARCDTVRIAMSQVVIHESWKKVLKNQFSAEYWQNLTEFVRQEYRTKKIYPPAKQIFRAFDLCPFEQVKVVIVGQDPYHGPNQANGLCFAVQSQEKILPSLKNIFKEIKADTGIEPLNSGDLTRWSDQGVLLLNSVLTVVAHSPASHKDKGWEQFTDHVIHVLNEQRSGIVYLLWGNYAKKKGQIINRERNLVLESGHPSPFSAQQFHGKHHFSQTNAYLALQGLSGINWR
ncbi:MAG: uracil-DNA glycosylase [Microgenomates group bacterium]